jgi:beta-lactamase superfamily II metal-dependent hydrolase
MQKVDNIIVKMYNTGSVGDCFLLLFQQQGKTTFTMLIDCGGYKTKKEDIIKCVEDIKTQIIDNSIDLVVVTHEHEDHVSGFNQARDLFDGITFKQVWMSWAENETDTLAKQLFAEKGKKVKALQSIIESNLTKVQQNLRSDIRQNGLNRSLKMRKTNFSNALEALKFENTQSLTSLGVRLKISDAMKYVKGKSVAKSKTKMYKKPGQVIDDLKGAEGVKFFILGPPYDSDLHGIKNDLDHSELYALAKRLGMSMNSFYFNAVTANATTNGVAKSPFSAKYKMDSKEEKVFNDGFYNASPNKWRQIEYDWLDSANELSIALTSYVNNTSLAMAIEIGDKVLLFPADAQSGNWMSWHDETVAKNLKKNGGKNADDLLAQTVFYKVGHHGSHNGTASVSGLEKMSQDKIMAFIPLVQDKVPSQWGGATNFPAKPLYKKLIEKTKGAIIRNDVGLIDDISAKNLRKQNYSATELDKMKKAASNSLCKEWAIKL